MQEVILLSDTIHSINTSNVRISKKTRCTGRCPCALCLQAGLPCDYNASYSRGRLPPVVFDEAALASRDDAENVDSSGHVSNVSQPVQELSPLSIGRRLDEETARSNTNLNVPNLASMAIPSSRTSPEPSQTDLQGHYVGPSSGVSFLLRVQKKLHQTLSFSHSSSIFTFGDAPLPEFDPTFFVLPPHSNAKELVDRYFNFVVPTHRFLHQPTVENWVEEFYETMGVMHDKENAPGRTAVLLMIFAQATDYMPNSNSAAKDKLDIRYFTVSKTLLVNNLTGTVLVIS